MMVTSKEIILDLNQCQGIPMCFVRGDNFGIIACLMHVTFSYKTVLGGISLDSTSLNALEYVAHSGLCSLSNTMRMISFNVSRMGIKSRIDCDRATYSASIINKK
jgi:hypothetical protein